MDDSPMFDEVTYDANTYTMNLNDVGLNSLYALDAECLSRRNLVIYTHTGGHMVCCERCSQPIAKVLCPWMIRPPASIRSAPGGELADRGSTRDLESGDGGSRHADDLVSRSLFRKPC